MNQFLILGILFGVLLLGSTVLSQSAIAFGPFVPTLEQMEKLGFVRTIEGIKKITTTGWGQVHPESSLVLDKNFCENNMKEKFENGVCVLTKNVTLKDVFIYSDLHIKKGVSVVFYNVIIYETSVVTNEGKITNEYIDGIEVWGTLRNYGEISNTGPIYFGGNEYSKIENFGTMTNDKVVKKFAGGTYEHTFQGRMIELNSNPNTNNHSLLHNWLCQQSDCGYGNWNNNSDMNLEMPSPLPNSEKPMVKEIMKVFEPKLGSITPLPASTVLDPEPSIPSWIKTTTQFWTEDQISDKEFVQGISFLIDNEIMQVPKITELENEVYDEIILASELADLLPIGTELPVNISSHTETNTNTTPDLTVPGWVKTTSGFWADGSISDKEFVQGISFLIDNEIMQVPKITELEKTVYEIQVLKDKIESDLEDHGKLFSSVDAFEKYAEVINEGGTMRCEWTAPCIASGDVCISNFGPAGIYSSSRGDAPEVYANCHYDRSMRELVCDGPRKYRYNEPSILLGENCELDELLNLYCDGKFITVLKQHGMGNLWCESHEPGYNEKESEDDYHEEGDHEEEYYDYASDGYVYTDKSSYTTGETILISGLIDEIAIGSTIEIGNQGNLMSGYVLYDQSRDGWGAISRDGTIEMSLYVDGESLIAEEGLYWINVFYSDYIFYTEFYYTP